MLVNQSNLDALRVGFDNRFQAGLGRADTSYAAIATVITATTKEMRYGWLGKIPNVREWIGPRELQNIMQHDYSIREKAWELTLSVDKDDIETDNLGIYAPLFEEMGQSTGSKWCQQVFSQLGLGFTTNCYDGQLFFDVDHPVIAADGSTVSVANTDGGSGTPWFLMDVSRPIKPIILQKRRDFAFQAMDQDNQHHVFMNKEFIYGSDARGNSGFGFWQMCWGSRQPLNAANYEVARTGVGGMKGDHGRPLGLNPRLLVVPPSLEGAANAIVKSALVNGGETNKWAGTAEVMVVPWLA